MQVIREIDRGGFGVVHEVEDNGLRLARKTFGPQIGNAAEIELLRRRFEREVRIQSVIRHPNVMPIAHSALAEDPPWFMMPLATESYEVKLRRDTSSGFDHTPWADLLAAVEELHRLGYVHRDLKPANILKVDGRWVLSDFGLVLPTMRDTTVLTGTNAAYGSRNYAAPEQAVDFRNTPLQADIFALGCILHDAVNPGAARVPFSQIRSTGPFGVILERATEFDYRRRFHSIAELRAALFDIWSSAATTTASLGQGNLLASLQAAPGDLDLWRRFILEVEGTDAHLRDPLLRQVNAKLLIELASNDEILLTRLVALICEWAASTSFEWEYCDVVGDRMLEVYRVAGVRLRAAIVVAALELAVSHNRWHVMRQVAGMLSAAADDGLVDRVLIEMTLDAEIAYRLRRIEVIIHQPRQNWHERIARRLSQTDVQEPQALRFVPTATSA